MAFYERYLVFLNCIAYISEVYIVGPLPFSVAYKTSGNSSNYAHEKLIYNMYIL